MKQELASKISQMHIHSYSYAEFGSVGSLMCKHFENGIGYMGLKMPFMRTFRT